MTPFLSRLTAAGAVLEPLRQAGEEVTLEWDTSITGPILGDQILVALPDLHLSDGGSGDVFVGVGSGARARMERLLRALVAAKASFPRTRVVQLGDLYDVWRAYPKLQGQLPERATYELIDKPYSEILDLLLNQLRARVCVGNHDAILALFPPFWARTADNEPTGQLACSHLFGSGRVLAFHGHQDKAVGEAMTALGGTGVVKLMTMAATLSAPLSQGLQQTFDLAAEFFEDPTPALFDGHWRQAAPPAAATGFSSPRWCDRNHREKLALLASRHPQAANLRLLIVGHSHCPGISMTEVQGRAVPLIDVGSWVQGKSQIAIAEEGRLTIYTVL